MLVIKNEQFQRFIAPDEASLVRLTRQILRECCPIRVDGYSDKLLDGMIGKGLDRARKYNFKKAETIVAFISVMFEIAPDFDDNELIKQVLADKNYSEDDRFFQLWQRVDQSIWQQSTDAYDAKKWFPDEK